MKHLIEIPQGATHVVADEGIAVDFIYMEVSRSAVHIEPVDPNDVEPNGESETTEPNSGPPHPRQKPHSEVGREAIEREYAKNETRLRPSLIFRGDLVKAWRAHEGLTGKELSEMVGYVGDASISNIESGFVRPTKGVIEKMATLMECVPVDLLDLR